MIGMWPAGDLGWNAGCDKKTSQDLPDLPCGIDPRARAPTYFLTADSRSGMSKDLLWWRAPESGG